MIYTGIDYHKRYSVACTLDAQGQKLHEARIDGNASAAFAAYFKKLGTPSEVVIEACWNWGVLYDLLEDTAGVAKVVLSHPAKNRIIADAQIKTDRIDAKALATLLRGDFVARVHLPSRDVRQRKNVVRQRLWLARIRTMIRGSRTGSGFGVWGRPRDSPRLIRRPFRPAPDPTSPPHQPRICRPDDREQDPATTDVFLSSNPHGREVGNEFRFERSTRPSGRPSSPPSCSPVDSGSSRRKKPPPRPVVSPLGRTPRAPSVSTGLFSASRPVS